MADTATGLLQWLPLISAIIGGTIVALANHILQSKIEFKKNRQEKAEGIVLCVATHIHLCRRLAESINNIKTAEEAGNFHLTSRKEGHQDKLALSAMEIFELSRIHFHKQEDSAIQLHKLTDTFIFGMDKFSRDILSNITRYGEIRLSSAASEYWSIIGELMQTARKLNEAIVEQMRAETKYFYRIRSYAHRLMTIARRKLPARNA